MSSPTRADDPLRRLAELQKQLDSPRPRGRDSDQRSTATAERESIEVLDTQPAFIPPGSPPGTGVPHHGFTDPPRPSRRRVRVVKVLVVLAVLALFGAVSSFMYARWRVGQIERVEVSDVLAPVPASGPTWLLVGSDSREGIDPDRPDAGGLLGVPVVGQRADAIILVRDIPGLGVQMLSLPRDLWLDPPGDNNATRINAAFNQGAGELIQIISQELRIPVHRYVEVDLAGLDDIVDAAGGVTVEIPNPGFDDSIGLRIDSSGPVALDGATALGYVRTRHWTEVIDGRNVLDGTGDIGRNQRQQSVLRALGSKVGGSKNPLTLNAAASGIVDAVRVDDGADMGDMYGLAKMLQRAERAPALPVVGHITGGGASVLLMTTGADEVLDLFR